MFNRFNRDRVLRMPILLFNLNSGNLSKSPTLQVKLLKLTN